MLSPRCHILHFQKIMHAFPQYFLQHHAFSTLSAVLCSPFLCRGIESWDLLKTGSKVATAEPNVFSRGSGRQAITSGLYVMIGVEEQKYKEFTHLRLSLYLIFMVAGRRCSMIFCSVVPARQQRKCESQHYVAGFQ